MNISYNIRDSILLPVKTKEDHKFLGWYDANKEWFEGIEYDKYYKKFHYKAAFKYLGEGFYTLMEEDCIFDNHKIYENFYFGAEKLIIPDSINGEFVYEIGCETFKDKNIKEVVLPSHIKVIDKDAFLENKLKAIIFPSSIKRLENGAFAVNEIDSVILPNTLDSISNYLFAVNLIKYLVIPSKIKYIGEGAFRENKLVSVKLHNKINYIGPKAFALNQFAEKDIPVLPLPEFKNKSLVYWQAFKKVYNKDIRKFEIIDVAKCQPGDKMDLNLGYKAVFKEDL